MLPAAKLSAATAATVSAALLSVTLTTPARAATEWDIPLAWPDGNFHVENVRTFAKVVSQVTGGEVVINVHPGGSLGFKGPEMLNAVRDGLVPIGDVLLNQQVGERKILGLEAQPYLIEDLDQLAIFHKHFARPSRRWPRSTTRRSSTWSRGRASTCTPRWMRRGSRTSPGSRSAPTTAPPPGCSTGSG